MSSAIYLFEMKTDLNERIENILFDYRTILKPDLPSSQKTISIKISATDIQLYHPMKLPEITAELVSNAWDILAAKKPRMVLFVFPFNSVPYEEPDFWKTLEKISNSEISPYFGVLNTLEREIRFGSLPSHIGERVIPASLELETSKNNVLRDYSLISYRGNQPVEHLITKTAMLELDDLNRKKLNRIVQKAFLSTEKNTNNKSIYLSDSRIKLNYRRPDISKSIDFSKIDFHEQAVENKIVIVGFDLSEVDKEASQRERETFYANTPWSGEKNSPSSENGIFYTESIATAIDNLTSGLYLSPPPIWLEWLLLIVFTAFVAYIWKFPPGWVFFLLIASCALLLTLHVISFSYFGTAFNISRPVVYSILTTVICAFFRSQRTLENRMSAQIKRKNQEELSTIHNRFLRLLSGEIRGRNLDISKEIEKILVECSGLDKKTKDILQEAATGAEELSDYLDGLYNISKIEKGQLEKPRYRDINLENICIRVIKQCHPEKNKIEVIVRSSGKESVESDPLYLHSVLHNLVSNAIKYSPENVGKVEINIEEFARKCVITVADNGPGIAGEYLERIFEKFYRIKDDTTYKIKGTGIGLYLTKYFAEMINCKIDVNSTPGKGSKFILTIPQKGQS